MNALAPLSRSTGAAAQAEAITADLLDRGYAVAGPDPIALGEKVGRPLFLLEERVKDRLDLTVAPVIVHQVGQHLVLTELAPKSRTLSERVKP